MKQKHSGFTLIELMIAVIMTSILLAIAIPSYKNYAQKARRSDAKAGITGVQLAEEKWRANNITYTTSIVDDLDLSTDSPDGYYTLSVTNTSANTYTITATAKVGEAQADDDACDSFSFDQSGTESAKDSSNNDSTAKCW